MDKCKECDKKLLYPLKCKCNNIYCIIHLTRHKCDFDYHTNNKRKLENELKKITKPRINL